MTLLSENEITWDQLIEEREWRRCFPNTRDPNKLMDGFEYWCANYAYIRHPERGRIKFVMFDAQRETAMGWLVDRYSLLLKARQLGFSTLVAAYCLWLSFGYEDRVIIMLSRTERDAIKLLAKAKYIYRFFPEWMKYRGPPMNATQTKLEFANESYMESLPSASDPARGESVYLAVIDELAYLPNSEEAWASIEPIADVGGRVIALSTANGEGNLFHKLWVGATTKNNRFKPQFHPWWANGRTQEWYDAQAAELPDWQLAQEYPDNPDDAFLRSGRPMFDLLTLRRLDEESTDPLERGDFLVYRGRAYFADVGGALKVWEFPNEHGRYALGADPAQGMEHGDYSSVHVINARNGHVVAHWHGRIDPDLFGTDVLAPLGKMYNWALVGVESNNHGLTTLKALQRAKYRPIYMQRSPRYKRSVPTEILGWRTSQITKPLAIDELNMALRDGSVTLWCKETIAELRTFVRDETGKKMSGSPFDDRTMSLAVANQMLKYVFLKQFEPELEPGPGTMGWMERQLYGDDVFSSARNRRRLGRDPIGQHWIRSDRRVP